MPGALVKVSATSFRSGLVLARRLTTEPLIRASIGLTFDQGAIGLDRSPAFQKWTDHNAQTLSEAKQRGEVLAHVDVAATAELLTGSFLGVQLLSQLRCQRHDLEQRAVTLFEHVLPAITVPVVLARLDITHGRAAQLLAAISDEPV
jgi:hypothetical protein